MNVELGYRFPARSSGPPAGKTVRIEFRKDTSKGKKSLGKMDIGAASIRWKGSDRSKWAKIPISDLERIFSKYYP
jgi:hypothetical protein